MNILPRRKGVRYDKPIYSELLKDKKCVTRGYLTPVWKKTFSPLARFIKFKGNINCNSKLLKHILNDHDPKKDMLNE